MSDAIEYRPIDGYPRYCVGSDGSVWSYRTDSLRRLKPVLNRNGYWQVTLNNESGPRNLTIHSVVASAFLGPRPPGQEVRHLNGDPLDIRAANLTYGTHRENMRDAVRHGTICHGSRQHLAKLTEADIPYIRDMDRDGLSAREIGRVFGVSRGTIRLVLNGVTWKHVGATAWGVAA